MKRLIMVMLFFMLLSCSAKVGKNIILSRDTVYMHNGIFLFYENLSDTTYRLAWGKNEIKNYSSIIRTLPSGKLNLYFASSKAIGLRQGCGTACFYAYVLPLSLHAKEKFYDYPMMIDTVNNLIAYCPNDDSQSFLKVENFVTDKSIKIDEDYLPGPYSGCAIDSIYFENRDLFIRWENSKNEITAKSFKLDSCLFEKIK